MFNLLELRPLSARSSRDEGGEGRGREGPPASRLVTGLNVTQEEEEEAFPFTPTSGSDPSSPLPLPPPSTTRPKLAIATARGEDTLFTARGAAIPALPTMGGDAALSVAPSAGEGFRLPTPTPVAAAAHAHAATVEHAAGFRTARVFRFEEE